MVNENELYKGLTVQEANKRLRVYGLNQINRNKKISPFKIFLSQFNDFIIWVLIAATIISGFMGEKADAITILVIVIMNAFLGFFQEYKTERSLEALKELASPTAKVIRNGNIEIINAEFIVLGDLIVLESGDRVPADCIILDSSNLMLDESLLTGESVGVTKSRYSKNCNTYMGTIVLKGKASVEVINTGMKTEMGKIANMLESIEIEKSPLKGKLDSLGKVLVVICISVCIVVTITGIWRGQDKYQMFLLGVSLAVAAIPEGLAAIVTVALALGVSRMSKRNALIRKLPAVETLGCTSIICSDKTGTLTQNNMTVKEMFYDGHLYKIDKEKLPGNKIIKKIFTYCNDCSFDFRKEKFNNCLFGDPTETALIKAVFDNKDDLKDLLINAERVYEIPFDSGRKMMSVIMKEGTKTSAYIKGAPERLIDKCKYIYEDNEIKPLTLYHKSKIKSVVEVMSLNALRCIGAAYKQSSLAKNNQIEEELIFVCVAGIIDPPRAEVKDAVLKCKIAGIRPIMITGDHKNTAFAIGKQLNICNTISEVLIGDEIEKLSEKELIEAVKKVTIFARVSPNHKLRIVRAFKKSNNIVAMTGDGVNDAPAVKEADIGIAMGISGTDVTKEASSMILLDDNFATIVTAVEEGRVIYNNIRKFIRYLLSCNLGEVLTMFLSSLMYLDLPLLPIQILFVNLATDGLPAIALGVDPPDKDIMLEKPRDKGEGIFSRGLSEKIILRGCLIGVCTILSFLIGKLLGMDLATCRTLTLGTLILSQLIHVFECRSEHHSIFEIKLFTNLYLVGAVLISILMLIIVIYVPYMQIIFHTVPLNIFQWLIVIFFSGIIALINSLYLYFKN